MVGIRGYKKMKFLFLFIDFVKKKRGTMNEFRNIKDIFLTIKSRISKTISYIHMSNMFYLVTEGLFTAL